MYKKRWCNKSTKLQFQLILNITLLFNNVTDTFYVNYMYNTPINAFIDSLFKKEWNKESA